MCGLCRKWEVSDRIPEGSVTAIVVMMLPFCNDGSMSKILASVLDRALYLYRLGVSKRIIFTNRFMKNGKNQARVAKEYLVARGVPEEHIIISKYPENPRLRNTFEEVRFAVRIVRQILRKPSTIEKPRILIVANHLHMRRVLAAFRRLLFLGRHVDVYWTGVEDQKAYDSDSAQERFWFPELFLAYEVAVYPPSVVKGWA